MPTAEIFNEHQEQTMVPHLEKAIIPIVVLQTVFAQNLECIKNLEASKWYFCHSRHSLNQFFSIFSKSKHLGPYVPS